VETVGLGEEKRMRPRLPHRLARHGLSRVEVVIILLMLVLLAGLIAVGIAHLRETARRMTCGNNLRQLAISVDNYHSANLRLPPLADVGDDVPTGRGLASVFAMLIPYLESTPYTLPQKDTPAANYHAPSSVTFTYQYKGGGSYSGGVANHVWKTFLCPADVTADKLRDVPVTLPDGSTGHYATGSYAANGLLPWNAKKAPLPSGAILFAERPQVCRTAAGETVHNLWGVGFYSPNMPTFATLAPEGFASTGQAAPVLPLPEQGMPVVRIGTENAIPQPPDFTFAFQRIRPSQLCDPRLPGSSHRDGMQAAMGDGSVRLFAADTPAWVFWAACVPPAVQP
jgi:hypothetical protein